jgi:hypothetical protein
MADPIPQEQLLDRLSRNDELIVLLLGTLRSIAERLGGTSGGGPIASDKAVNLRITTIPLGLKDTEVKWQFTPGMKTFVLKTRNGNAVRMATDPGLVAISHDPFFTLNPLTVYSQDDLNIGNVQPYPTLYFACGVDNEVLELIIGE